MAVVHDANLEVFVLQKLSAIRDACGRSAEQKALRESAQHLLGEPLCLRWRPSLLLLLC